MSGLHRDINVLRNFLPSRRLQKPREQSGNREDSRTGRPPSHRVQSGLSFGILLHRPKGSRKTVWLMSVWSNGPYSLEGTIKPDPLAPGDHTFSTESKLGFQFFIQVERIPLVLISSSCNLENREREEESRGGVGSVGSSSTLYFCSNWFVLLRSPGSSIHNSWVF